MNKNFIITFILMMMMSVIGVSAYNYYTQINSPPLLMNTSNIDFGTRVSDSNNGYYYGVSPINPVTGTANVVAKFNLSNVLGSYFLLEQQRYTASATTVIKDISIDPATGVLYILECSNSSTPGQPLLIAVNSADLTGTFTNYPSGSGLLSTLPSCLSKGSANYSISVNTHYSPNMIISYDNNNGTSTAYFINNAVNNSGQIPLLNSSVQETLNLNNFVSYVNVVSLKFSSDQTYSNYYIMLNPVDDRTSDPHTNYMLARNDHSLTGLFATEWDNLSNTQLNRLVLSPDFGTTLQMFKLISGKYYLYNVQHTNFTALSNGSGSCFTGYGCYNTSAYCLDTPGYYCNNTVFNIFTNLQTGLPFVGAQCNQAYASYCTTGCQNQLINGVYTGVCTSNTTCVNTCNIQGLKSCTNTNTYATCDFYQGSACLSMGNFIQCPFSNGCVAGTCLYGLSNASIATSPSFTVTPYSDSTNVSNAGTSNYYIIRNVDYTKSQVSILSSLITVNQGFYISTNALGTYTARNCDYRQVNVYNNDTLVTLNASQSFAFNYYNSGYVNLTFLPYADGVTTNVSDVLVTGQDPSNNYIFRYFIERDFNKNICLYQASSSNNESTSFVCDQSTGAISNINLQVQTITEVGGNIKYSALFTITHIDGTTTSYATNWFSMEQLSSTLYKITLNPKNNLSILSENVFNGQNYNVSWEATTPNMYQQYCLYVTNGCRDVRTYLTDSTLSLFNFKDWTVCINNGVNGEALSQNPIITSKLNPMTRILISLGVSVGIFIIIMIIGFIVVGRTGNQLHLQIFSFAGLVFSIGFLIYFAVLGWLPAWILILMMLVSAGIIVLIVRSMVTGGNGG